MNALIDMNLWSQSYYSRWLWIGSAFVFWQLYILLNELLRIHKIVTLNHETRILHALVKVVLYTLELWLILWLVKLLTLKKLLVGYFLGCHLSCWIKVFIVLIKSIIHVCRLLIIVYSWSVHGSSYLAIALNMLILLILLFDMIRAINVGETLRPLDRNVIHIVSGHFFSQLANLAAIIFITYPSSLILGSRAISRKAASFRVRLSSHSSWLLLNSRCLASWWLSFHATTHTYDNRLGLWRMHMLVLVVHWLLKKAVSLLLLSNVLYNGGTNCFW